MSADPLGSTRHSLRTEIGGIGQHWRDISWDVTGANMREVVGKAGPIVHFLQQIWHLNHRIHITDLGIEVRGFGRDLAGRWRHDQSPGLKADTFKLSRPSSVCEALQIEVEHLLHIGKPRRAVTLDAQPETILLFHCGECRARHQMLVDQGERLLLRLTV